MLIGWKAKLQCKIRFRQIPSYHQHRLQQGKWISHLLSFLQTYQKHQKFMFYQNSDVFFHFTIFEMKSTDEFLSIKSFQIMSRYSIPQFSKVLRNISKHKLISIHKFEFRIYTYSSFILMTDCELEVQYFIMIKVYPAKIVNCQNELYLCS